MTTTSPISVSCPTCESHFPVDPEKVPAQGLHAICSACWRVFFVEHSLPAPMLEEVDPEPAPAGPETAVDAEEVTERRESGEPPLDEGSPGGAEWSPFEDLTSVDRQTFVEEQVEETRGPPPSEEGGRAPASSPFGNRDPHERARRLARVLASDIITYHPEKHAQAIAEGSLEEEFEEEVRKSWEEYAAQVGPELAQSTRYFQDALNEILARGRRIY